MCKHKISEYRSVIHPGQEACCKFNFCSTTDLQVMSTLLICSTYLNVGTGISVRSSRVKVDFKKLMSCQ